MATAKELETALRMRANSLKNNAQVVAITGLTFRYVDGSEKTIKFNENKSWYDKPSVFKPTNDSEMELLEFSWCDPNITQNGNEVNGEGNIAYFLTEQVEDVFIDPAKVVDFRFNYIKKTVTNVVVQSDNSEEPAEPEPTE